MLVVCKTFIIDRSHMTTNQSWDLNIGYLPWFTMIATIHGMSFPKNFSTSLHTNPILEGFAIIEITFSNYLLLPKAARLTCHGKSSSALKSPHTADVNAFISRKTYCLTNGKSCLTLQAGLFLLWQHGLTRRRWNGNPELLLRYTQIK